MRSSREQAEKNRQGVIDTASRLFRERGFDGVGVIELMGAAGMTKGAFYKQFESKDDLAALASKRAMEIAIARWTRLVDARLNAPIEALIDLYLSDEHRGALKDGCPLVALGADAARQSSEVKDSFEDGVRAHLALLNDHVLAARRGKGSAKASAILALMVGALTLSRMVNSKELSDGFLDAAAEQVRVIAAK